MCVQLVTLQSAYENMGLANQREEQRIKRQDPRKAEQAERLGMGLGIKRWGGLGIKRWGGLGIERWGGLGLKRWRGRNILNLSNYYYLITDSSIALWPWIIYHNSRVNPFHFSLKNIHNSSWFLGLLHWARSPITVQFFSIGSKSKLWSGQLISEMLSSSRKFLAF